MSSDRKPSLMTAAQSDLLIRRKNGFDEWLGERMPVLRDFAAALELPDPTLIVADPGSYLPPIDAWLARQVIAAADVAWLTARLHYLVGEILVRRFSGCWLVCEAPESRFFARYVVGQFHKVPNPAAMADPFEIAAACTSEPPGRSLIRTLEVASRELLLA